MVPVLLVYAALTLVWVVRQVVTMRPWRLAVLVVLLIPGYAIAYQRVPRINFRVNYMNLGNAHRDLGELEEAIENYDRSLAISPNYHYALFKKGQVLGRMGRTTEARETLERALAEARRQNDALNVRRIQGALRRLEGH
ncbi:MAG: tetratricopeptide repeat protein [Phycisphaerae bacterium]|jgi:tetratricopeptide (TPR) repeat protein